MHAARPAAFSWEQTQTPQPAQIIDVVVSGKAAYGHEAVTQLTYEQAIVNADSYSMHILWRLQATADLLQLISHLQYMRMSMVLP
jgi:16S rRNA G966 N2-methylase RsmD